MKNRPIMMLVLWASSLAAMLFFAWWSLPLAPWAITACFGLAALWHVADTWIQLRRVDIDERVEAARQSIEAFKEELRQDVKSDLTTLNDRVNALSFKDTMVRR